MSIGESRPTKRGPKPRCSKCGQVLSKNLFDKCVWCGEALPDAIRLSEDEKNTILKQQKNELIAKDTTRMKRKLESDNYTHDWSFRSIVNQNDR